MQDFLRPGQVANLKEGLSPSSAQTSWVGQCCPTVLQSRGKFLLVEEFQWAEMHPGLGAEPQPPGRTTKDPWSNSGIGNFKKFLCIMHWAHWIELYRGNLQLHTRLTSTLSTQELIIMARIIPFRVPPLYQLSLIFGQNDSTGSYLVNRASLQLQLWHSSLSMQHTQLQQAQQPCVILLLVLGN